MQIKNNTLSVDKAGISAAFLTASGWGMAGIFIQLIQDISALSIVAIRLILALVVLIPILLVVRTNFWNDIKALRNPTVWGLGAILFACYTLGTISFQMAPVGEATLLMTTAPLFVILYKLFAKNPVSKNEYTGALLATIGISLIMLPNINFDSSMSNERIIGDGLAILVSILFAINAIFFNTLSKSQNAPNSISVTLMTFSIGSIMFLIFLPDISVISLEYNNFVALSSLVFLGIISTAIPTISYAIAAKRLPPIMTTGILLFEPVLAIIFSFIILYEIPSVWLAPGLLFIIVGLIYMAKSSTKEGK